MLTAEDGGAPGLAPFGVTPRTSEHPAAPRPSHARGGPLQRGHTGVGDVGSSPM